jgi:hypothetical protein
LREGHEIGSRKGRMQGCALRMAQHIQLWQHPGARFITISGYWTLGASRRSTLTQRYLDVYTSISPSYFQRYRYAFQAYLRAKRPFPLGKYRR